MATPLRSIVGLVLTSVALAGGLVACGADDGAGQALPDIDVSPLAGGAPISLASLDGPAVINLWATTCVPCRTEMPAFEAVHQTRGDTITFVGLNIGESAEQASPFIDEVGVTYDQFLDELGYATTALEASAMPTTIVVDGDGNIATRHIGEMSVADLNAAIDQVLRSDS